MKFTGALAAFLSGLCVLLLPGRVLSGGYCVAVCNTPVLNTPRFHEVFGGDDEGGLSLDSSGLLRELEFIAFPGTVFVVHERFDERGVLRVSSGCYPEGGEELYLDERFVRREDCRPAARPKAAPSLPGVIEKLESAAGESYLWGGNTRSGVPLMSIYYPPGGVELSGSVSRKWNLRGLDCSGLLYFASGGYTPRNTSSLVTFGAALEIEGLSPGAIAALLRPLDLIVWEGHVFIALDDERVIESSRDRGVHLSATRERLECLMKQKSPADSWEASSGSRFVARRWLE